MYALKLDGLELGKRQKLNEHRGRPNCAKNIPTLPEFSKTSTGLQSFIRDSMVLFCWSEAGREAREGDSSIVGVAVFGPVSFGDVISSVLLLVLAPLPLVAIGGCSEVQDAKRVRNGVPKWRVGVDRYLTLRPGRSSVYGHREQMFYCY